MFGWQNLPKLVMFLTHIRARLFTVLFFRKIIEIEGFVLRTAILHECKNYLGGGSGSGGGGGLEGSEKNIFPYFSRSFPPRPEL